MVVTNSLNGWAFWIIAGFASILCFQHIFILYIFSWVQHDANNHSTKNYLNPRVIATSLGGGIAIAYVFLQLLPELDNAYHFHIALYGFVIVYGINHLISKVISSNGDDKIHLEKRWKCVISIIILFIYNALIIYTMKEHLKHGTASIIKFMIAMVLHLFGSDFGLLERQFIYFKSWGRFVLAAAPITGWLIIWLAPDFGLHPDILTSVLAGFIMLNVFKEELPENKHTSFRWFVCGIVLFAVLIMLK